MLTALVTDLPAPVHGRSIRLLNDKGYGMAYIQTGVTQCCGMNALFSFSLSLLDTAAKVKQFYDDLALAPWQVPKTGPAPYYVMKHFIFTCGMGKYGSYNREDNYKHLIADPRVKLISRQPSQSERDEGHDIGIFLLDLT